MQGRNKKTFKVISADTLVLFLLTLAAFSRWDLLANPLAPSGSVLEKFPRVLAPFLRLFLPAEGAVLFSPYRWMLVSLLVLFLLVYLVLDVVRNLEGEGLRLPFGLNFGRLVFGIKTAILIYIVAVIVILPALQQISRRHSSQRPWEFANDNVVQTEEAIRFVVSGRNPYREDYLRTPMVRFHSDSENRALHHFVYMPSDVLLSIPFYLFSKRFVGWYDQRFVYLLLFVLLLWILPRFAQEEEKKLSLLAIFALNPFVAPFVVEGRNDVFTLFWIVVSVYFLLRQRNALSVVSLAVAGTHKLFALLLLPFYWVYLLGTTRLSRRELFEGLRSRKKEIALFLLTVGVILLPFVFWDFGAFIDDVWLYGVGRTFKSMPVEGPTTFGVGTLVLYAGAVKSIDAYFPFWIFQLAAGLPLLVYFLRKQAGTGSMQIAILGYSIVLFVALFFSRFFHDNYLGFVVTLLAWASLGDFDSTVRDET
jgi:hypothetical protein